MSVQRRSQSIEFTVLSRENLYLEGKNEILFRVKKGQSYPCQMNKDQQFSCLFSHYAKHNGLDKDNLRFFFVDELEQEQTPLSVHLMPEDHIHVEHRRRPYTQHASAAEPLKEFPSEFKWLLAERAHADVEFMVGSVQRRVRAHKAILAARSEYFQVMFQSGMMIESSNGCVNISTEFKVFQQLLEFIYTNTVEDISRCTADEVVQLLIAADEYLLADLKRLCEEMLTRHLDHDNIAPLFLVSKTFCASTLAHECRVYLNDHLTHLKTVPSFRKELMTNNELSLLVIDSLGDVDAMLRPSGRKRMRLSGSDDTGDVSFAADLDERSPHMFRYLDSAGDSSNQIRATGIMRTPRIDTGTSEVGSADSPPAAAAAATASSGAVDLRQRPEAPSFSSVSAPMREPVTATTPFSGQNSQGSDQAVYDTDGHASTNISNSISSARRTRSRPNDENSSNPEVNHGQNRVGQHIPLLEDTR
jgi:hypothetical protein